MLFKNIIKRIGKWIHYNHIKSDIVVNNNQDDSNETSEKHSSELIPNVEENANMILMLQSFPVEREIILILQQLQVLVFQYKFKK